MTKDRFDDLHEALIQIAEKRNQADRLIAADLPGEGIFPIFWDMVSKLVTAGLKATDERNAGNVLTMITEELPSAMHYAAVQADQGPDRDAEPTVAVLEEMLQTAKAALGDRHYRDMAMDVRRPT
jgi:hypothetical protein